MKPNVPKIQKLLADNSPVILTAIGVTGTITTAFLTGKASFRAAEIIAAEQGELDYVLPSREKLDLVWKLYIPPVSTGAFTLVCIVGANRIGTRRAAAIAAAYSLTDQAFAEYRDKVVQKIGEGKERAVRDELAQDRVTNNPSGNLVVIQSGDVLCYEAYTGRYFTSNMENLRGAMNDINATVLHHGYASLSDFYQCVGLPSTASSDDMGWRDDKLLELQFSTVLSTDNRPCISFEYRVEPIRDFYKFGG